MAKQFYFHQFDHRQPYQAIPDNKYRTLVFQFCGIFTICLGISYIAWRWQYSLNPLALWFSIPLALAETLSFIGTILFIFNVWSNKDPVKKPPVHLLSDIEELDTRADRPLKIDIYIATYNEDVELVRHSIADAKKVIYPFDDVVLKIYVLDDGRRDGRDPSRENMKQVADEEGVGYLLREHNQGYKAGNLKNALEQTDGDLFVILDADTRIFPNFLLNTTGYFRQKKLAWVQTPQWFYDLTEPQKLSDIIHAKLPRIGRRLKPIVNKLFGKVKLNEDIFGNEPRLFYDVLLRRRNYYNAAFCCGAGSIHRREAVMGLAVKDFARGIKKYETDLHHQLKDEREIQWKKNEFIVTQEVIPFKFHASEDIYTSIMLHADKENNWESIHHPDVECKMLSTQDLDSRIKQFSRYASGSLDIAIKDNPLFKKGLSLGQRLCYFNTIWSYFSSIWLIIFLASPLIFFFTLTPAVKAYSFDFFKHFLPFQVMNTITIMLGCWGIVTSRAEQYCIAGFWYMLRALISTAKGEKVKFNVTPKDRTVSKNMQHILPHIILISLSAIGIVYNVVLLCIGLHPSASGFVANLFWCLFNVGALSIMIRAAYYKPLETSAINQN